MITTKQTFYSTSEEERKAFTQVLPLFKKHYSLKGQELIYHITPSKSFSSYDFLIHVYDSEGRKVESLIVEVKVRSKHYSTLMLEKSKFITLNKLKKIEEQSFPKVSILYLNFTPSGTYLFNLTDKRYPWELSEQNKSTVVSTTHKIEKWVTYLDIYTDGNDMKIIYDKNKGRKEVVNKLSEQERYRCIFDSVEKMNEE